MDYQTVITERTHHIGNITLDRPEVLNIPNIQLAEETNSALVELEAAIDKVLGKH